MKKTIAILFLAVMALTASAQIKKDKPAATTAAKIVTNDSISLKVKIITDTMAARLLYYVEDGSLIWRKGFVLNSIAVFASGSKVQDRQLVTDDKFTPVKPEDLYDVRTLPKKQ